jgi:hypothetical protein
VTYIVDCMLLSWLQIFASRWEASPGLWVSVCGSVSGWNNVGWSIAASMCERVNLVASVNKSSSLSSILVRWSIHFTLSYLVWYVGYSRKDGLMSIEVVLLAWS